MAPKRTSTRRRDETIEIEEVAKSVRYLMSVISRAYLLQGALDPESDEAALLTNTMSTAGLKPELATPSEDALVRQEHERQFLAKLVALCRETYEATPVLYFPVRPRDRLLPITLAHVDQDLAYPEQRRVLATAISETRTRKLPVTKACEQIRRVLVELDLRLKVRKERATADLKSWWAETAQTSPLDAATLLLELTEAPSRTARRNRTQYLRLARLLSALAEVPTSIQLVTALSLLGVEDAEIQQLLETRASKLKPMSTSAENARVKLQSLLADPKRPLNADELNSMEDTDFETLLIGLNESLHHG